jgi:hypothetical protein
MGAHVLLALLGFTSSLKETYNAANVQAIKQHFEKQVSTTLIVCAIVVLNCYCTITFILTTVPPAQQVNTNKRQAFLSLVCLVRQTQRLKMLQHQNTKTVCVLPVIINMLQTVARALCVLLTHIKT